MLNDRPAAVGKLEQALRYAVEGFGPAGDVTLEVRADLAAMHHEAGRPADAWRVIRDGHAAAQATLRADPTLAAYKPARHLARSWEDLLAVGVLLPPDGGPTDDALWAEYAAALVTSKVPADDDAPSLPKKDYFYTVAQQRARQPADRETATRKRLAHLDANPPERYDTRDRLAYTLAVLILDQKGGRYEESERLLRRVYDVAVTPVPPDLDGSVGLRQQRLQLLRDTLDQMVKLYSEWGKPALAAERRAERYRLFPELAPRPQRAN